MPEGRQSPPPERQSGRQQRAPPASGHRTEEANRKDDKPGKSQLENLESNPKGPMDDQLEHKFAKQTGNYP